MNKLTSPKYLKFLNIGLVILIILLILAIFTFPYVIAMVYKFKTQSNIQNTNLIENTTQQKKLAIEELPFQNKSKIYYKVRGRFTNDILFQGDFLRGEFVIDGDTTQTPIATFFPPKTGSINIGQFIDTDSNSVTFSSVKSERLLELVKPDVQVELRLSASVSNQDNYKALQSIMDTLLLGQPPNESMYFMPEAIVFLE